MTALRFQTGGRHQTSPASLRGALEEEKDKWRNVKRQVKSPFMMMDKVERDLRKN